MYDVNGTKQNFIFVKYLMHFDQKVNAIKLHGCHFNYIFNWLKHFIVIHIYFGFH